MKASEGQSRRFGDKGREARLRWVWTCPEEGQLIEEGRKKPGGRAEKMYGCDGGGKVKLVSSSGCG